MTRIDSHNHTEKRAVSKIFMSRFHILRSSKKFRSWMPMHRGTNIYVPSLMMSPVFFYIIHLFRKDANRNLFISIDLKMIFGCLEMKRFINSALFQSVAPAHDSSQESYQYSQIQCEAPVHNPGD